MTPIMANEGSRADTDRRKHRAKLARQHHRATKAWDLDARAAVAGSIWRVDSAWIEETSNTPCAEFVNASNGKTHALKITQSIDDRRSEIQRLLSINVEPTRTAPREPARPLATTYSGNPGNPAT